MSIQIKITIRDAGATESRSLVGLLSQVESVTRNAAAIAAIRVANELELTPSLTQLALLQVLTHPSSYFLIERVGAGSKIFWGRIVAGAILTTVFSNTLGESIKDGWIDTKSHKFISEMVPKIEQYIVAEFHRLFLDHQTPPVAGLRIDPVAIRKEDDEESIIEIMAQSTEGHLFD